MMNLKKISRFGIVNLIVLLTIIATFKVDAHSKSFSILLHRCNLDEVEHRFNPGDEWKRSADKPVMCVISEEGIVLSDINISSILKYELYDKKGNYIATFENQKDFIDYIYNNNAAMIILLVFDDYGLIGCIDT